MAEADSNKIYDCIIIGAGPAGMGAAIYAARYKVDCLVIGQETGGTANLAHDIENWPGFKGPGWELMDKFKEHVVSFGVPIVTDIVSAIAKKDDVFEVMADNGTFRGRTIILATGTKRRKLGIPREDELTGRGVSYCATCDCVFMKDKVVGVIGGSDAAAMAAQILSQHAKQVIIIYRQGSMRAEPARVEDLENDPKVSFEFNANVAELIGEQKLEKVRLDNGKELVLDGLFIEIGGIPLTQLAAELGIALAGNGRVVVDAGMSTDVRGVFAAGDLTTGSNQFNQIATAVAEGSIAALSDFDLIKSLKKG